MPVYGRAREIRGSRPRARLFKPQSKQVSHGARNKKKLLTRNLRISDFQIFCQEAEGGVASRTIPT
jgi:hypothetical protein